LENDETSFSQTLQNSTTYVSTGSTRLARGIPARPKINRKPISEARNPVTDGIEGCAVRNPLSASTSTSAKSAVENTGRKIANGRRLGEFEPRAKHPRYAFDCFERPLANRLNQPAYSPTWPYFFYNTLATRLASGLKVGLFETPHGLLGVLKK
jgi:hypothetical protein